MLIHLGQDVIRVFLTHTFYIDTVIDPKWSSLYYEAKQFRSLINFFMSPIFHAFLLVENFFVAKEDIFKWFPDQDPQVYDYFEIAIKMLRDEEGGSYAA
jgi:hypothetical protein